MPFKLIKGTYHVRSYSPDGDSIRFQPDDPNLVHNLDGFTPRFNARNHVQLRIEAIDSLETHYTIQSGGGVVHQPWPMAKKAADELLAFVGITNAQLNRNGSSVVMADDGTPGYILSRSVEKNGRPVAFVFAGETDHRDGERAFLNTDWLTSSYNYFALEKGLAYPTYYRGLFGDLREKLTTATKTARASKVGIYQLDKTNEGITVVSLETITEHYGVLPKLFRRLSEYIANYGTAKGFKQKLAQSKEPVLDLMTANFTHFDTFIEQKDDSEKIRLTRLPEELVFDEMPSRPSNSFSAIVNNEISGPPRFVRTVTLPEESVRDVSV